MKTVIGKLNYINSLPLNDKVWRDPRTRKCSLCNLNENESTFHFLCICPILAGIRLSFLGKAPLSFTECINWLNGEEWDQLYEFVKTALKYRNDFIYEFNY